MNKNTTPKAASPKSNSKTLAAKPEAKSAPKIPVAKEVKPETPKSASKIAAAAAAPAPAKPRTEESMPLPPRPAAAQPAREEAPAPQSTMTPEQIAHFRALLEEKRDDILRKAKQTLDEDMALDANDLPDEMDLASSEYLQSFTFRLRGREKSFLDKIAKAVERMEAGSFGICEECGEEISLKRLEARPETTLCIRCKEDQERAEKDFG